MTVYIKTNTLKGRNISGKGYSFVGGSVNSYRGKAEAAVAHNHIVRIKAKASFDIVNDKGEVLLAKIESMVPGSINFHDYGADVRNTDADSSAEFSKLMDAANKLNTSDVASTLQFMCKDLDINVYNLVQEGISIGEQLNHIPRVIKHMNTDSHDPRSKDYQGLLHLSYTNGLTYPVVPAESNLAESPEVLEGDISVDMLSEEDAVVSTEPVDKKNKRK